MMAILIDGYPLPDDDPELGIQMQINAYLAGPANEPSFGSTAGRVLSGTTTPEERYRWLFPLLRRSKWLLEHPESASPNWAAYLMCAVHILLNHNRQQTEPELLALLGYSSVFRRTQEIGGYDELAPRAVGALRKTSDKAAWIEAFQSACFEAEQFPTIHGGRVAAQLGMALMLEPAAPKLESPCWSAIIDIPNATWRTLFALADTALMFPQEPKAAKVAAAVKKIGPVAFAEKLNAWTAHLSYLSWRGVAVLKILLHGAAASPTPELQPALLRFAKAEWRQQDRAAVVVDLLVTAIVAQPPEFARGCLETLAARRYTKNSAALDVALSAPQKGDSPLGIDGYPLDERPQHAIFQHRLDEWLRRPGSILERTAGPDLRSLALRGPEADYEGLLSAMLDRIDWVSKHRELVPPHFDMTRILSRFLPELQDRMKEVDRPTLMRLMNADTKGALYCSPGEHILATLERYLEHKPFDVELVGVIEAWHKSSHGSIAEQTLRRHLGWLLWREDVKPVNLKACWSARIRQDLRDMPAFGGKEWRALLANMTFHMASTPPAKWKKLTAAPLRAIGPEEFARWFHRWLKPFGEAVPLPLEASGGDVLRCLLWHAAEIDDPRIDEALGWFPHAQWKSKKAKGYTSKLMGPFVYTLSKKSDELAHASLETLVQNGDILNGSKNFDAYRALCEKLGRPLCEGDSLPPPPTIESLTLKRLKQEGCEVTDDAVVVRGELEEYSIDRRTRAIRRIRDGATLKIEANGPEGEMITQMFNWIKPTGLDDLRVVMPLVRILKMDRAFGRYLKVDQSGPRIQ